MHFALICLPFKSHIAMFEVLADELLSRGHRISFLVNAGAAKHVSRRFQVHAIEGTTEKQLDAVVARAAQPSGLFGILRTVRDGAILSDAFCKHGPAHLRALHADAILGDQMEPAAGLVARYLGLPFISMACALPVEREEGIPLPFLSWPYDPSAKGLKRNRGGERVARILMTRQRRLIRQWVRQFQLADPCEDLQSCLSDTATIAQTTAEFDFPRRAAERPLHMVGPLRRDERESSLPFEPDPAKPFIFMSLGTLQGHRYRLFQAAATACRALDAQLLVAHCGGLTSEQAAALWATWVTDFAPQRAVLKYADLCITHGGLNTVMDALEFATPLLVLPIAFDQPGVAARVTYRGVGRRLSPRFVTAAKLEKEINLLLSDTRYRHRAGEIGRSIADAGGLKRAVDIIETTLLRDRDKAARQ